MAASLLSFVWPGFGQFYLQRRKRAIVFALPPLILLAGLTFVILQSPQAFALRLLVPSFALGVIAVLGIHAAWRVSAILDTWISSRRKRVLRDPSAAVALALCLAVVMVHGVAAFYVESVADAGKQIFQGDNDSARPSPGDLDQWMGTAPTPTPPAGETPAPSPLEPSPSITPRPTVVADGPITILFVGVDSGFDRDHALTDSLFLTSYDPRLQRVVQISVPRDTARFPLFTGDRYEERINTFMRFANRNPDHFPGPALATLAHEIGYIVGIDIPYYAIINMEGFVQLVDLVGGVDVTVDQPISDPHWQFELGVGQHHLDGATALIYVRSRYGPDNSDYERARRQQQIVLAVAKRVRDPQVMARLPDVASKAAELIRTNVPLNDLDKLIEITDGVNSAAVESYVLEPPAYAHQIPVSETGGAWKIELDMDAVAQLSIDIFGDESLYSQNAQP
jgi:LCP family protein required for cell wall assembly